MSKYWDIYEQELYMLGHGLPIWEAEPFSVRDEVQVGDVGYMYEGRFRRVFNVFYEDTSGQPINTSSPNPLPPSDLFIPFAYERPHPNVYGVPSGHVPLTMPAWEFAIHGHIPQGPHSGERCQLKEVRPHTGVDPSGPVPVEVGASLAFSSERRRGAALFLRSDGVRWQAPVALFRDYCKALWEPWREFTRDCAAHSEGADQLMFVYGHTKTTAWTCVAVEQSRSANAISLDVELPAIGSGGLEFRQSLTLTRSPHVNHGPWHLEGGAAQAGELKRNQTVFIRRLMASDRSSLDKIRYKMTYRIGRRDVSLGGPAADKSAKASGKERQQPSSEESARSHQDRTRGASKYSSIIADLADFGMYSVLREEESEDHIFHMDPLEVLSLYILETEPNAHHVVVSDDDVDGLLESFKALHASLPENIAVLLDQLRPDTTLLDSGVSRSEESVKHWRDDVNTNPASTDLNQVIQQETSASSSEVKPERRMQELHPVVIKGLLFRTDPVEVHCQLGIAVPLVYAVGESIPLSMTLTTPDRPAVDLLAVSQAIDVRLFKTMTFGKNAHEIAPSYRATYKRKECVGIALWVPESSGQLPPLPGDDRPRWRVRLRGALPTHEDAKVNSTSFEYEHMAMMYTVNLFPFKAKDFHPFLAADKELIILKVTINDS